MACSQKKKKPAAGKAERYDPDDLEKKRGRRTML